MTGQTLIQKYYAINDALQNFLESKNVRCPVIKFGVDPATLKFKLKDQTVNRYPYIQTFIAKARSTAWTSDKSGIYTLFEFQLSFFTSPENEFENDVELYKPFYLAKIALSDIDLGVLKRIDDAATGGVMIANLQRIREENSFSMVSGAPVPKAVLIADFSCVCGYPVDLPGVGLSTNDLAALPQYDFSGV